MSLTSLAFNRSVQLLPFLAVFERRGGQVAPVLKAAGLEGFDISDPTILITGNALYRAIEEMSNVLGDPYFAARAATEFVEDGPVFVRESYSVAHTLAEFLPLAIMELDRQVSNMQLSIRVSSETTTIFSKRTFLPNVPLTQTDAANVTIWIVLLRYVSAEKFDPSRLTVTVQKRGGIPPDILPKSAVVVSKWNGISIAFPSEWLTSPLNMDWQFPPVQRGEFHEKSLRDEICNYIAKMCRARMADKTFTIESLAKSFGTTPRSVQRTLQELGTSFQNIRDDVRCKKAIELVLSDILLPQEQIAESLGFSSGPSFSRAFKRWTGTSPEMFRNEKLA